MRIEHTTDREWGVSIYKSKLKMTIKAKPISYNIHISFVLCQAMVRLTIKLLRVNKLFSSLHIAINGIHPICGTSELQFSISGKNRNEIRSRLIPPMEILKTRERTSYS